MIMDFNLKGNSWAFIDEAKNTSRADQLKPKEI